MISLGVGLQEQTVGRFLQSGLFGTITVASQSDLPGPLAQLGARGGRRGFGGFRGRGGAAAASEVPAAKLDDAALKQISALENVREVYPNLRLPVEMSLDGFSQTVPAIGVPMSSRNEGSFQTLSFGRFFADENEHACMFSLDMARQIDRQNPGSLIGKTAKLSYAATATDVKGAAFNGGFQVHRADLECRVEGIVERSVGSLPVGPGIPLLSVVIPLAMARKINDEIVANAQSLMRDPGEPRSYSTLTVKVRQPQYTQDIEDRLRQMGFTVFSADDALRGAKNAFIILDIFLSLIGSIALAVSSLGIVNTMVMSILERTREIGIMKAIGASDGDIRRIFLIEASVIGVFGGLAGIALAWIVGQVINFGANLYIRSQGGTAGTLFSLPLWLIASAIGFSIAVSLAAGSYPAARAAKLDPIHALRHD